MDVLVWQNMMQNMIFMSEPAGYRLYFSICRSHNDHFKHKKQQQKNKNLFKFVSSLQVDYFP